MNPILQCSPQANYLAHKSAIDTAIERVLSSGWFILGREVEAFEREFASFLGANHVVGVGNGTDALEIALRVFDVGSQDAVITVSHTAMATVAAIKRTGATPLFVDIDPQTCTMDPEALAEAVESPQLAGLAIKAIIVVHLYGHLADMPSITALAKRHGLWLIEDCAQSHGAALDGKRAGCWGDMAAFSFYPTKNLGALGDGGALATADPKFAAKARLFREYGWKERYVSELHGMNSRLDELQAAILRVKLQHLEEENSRRQELARRYQSHLASLPLRLPSSRPGASHVFHQFVVRHQKRDLLREYLARHSISTLIHYPQPIHLQPVFRNHPPLISGTLEVTEGICREILSLPMYAQLADCEVDEVCQVVADWFSKENQ